jgi:hypothetical protein
MKELQLDCSKICCFIKVDESGIIIETAPIFRKFTGQPLENLLSWVTQNFDYCALKEIKK